MKKLLSILLWSVIAAAFIGPGTVTTAASSGVRFGFALLWALVFSTIATLTLQEAAARITVGSGMTLGRALRTRYSRGPQGMFVLLLVLGAIVFGCAAYEAGNILGGVAGAALGTSLDPRTLTLLIGAAAGVVLWMGTPRAVAYALSLAVGFMGVAFLVTAIRLAPPLDAVIGGALVPRMPDGSGLLVLGLIGTTVVPYNLFLGSGMAKGQTIGDLRLGLAVSIILGGGISMAVIIVGAAGAEPFSYEALMNTLASRIGRWGGVMFAFGLFAAGLSSAITAPLAAAITAQGLFAEDADDHWSERGRRYRAVWMGVLAVGIAFGLTDVQPVPAIIIAQALNGIVLPLAATFLFMVVNDRNVMGRHVNGTASNVVMAIVVLVTIVLGTSNVLKAAFRAMGLPTPDVRLVLIVAGVVAAMIAWPTYRIVRPRAET